MERITQKPTENIQPRTLAERAEKLAKNKFARAAAAVALTLAAAHVADTKSAEAQTPPPANSVLTNGDFELPDPNSTLPTAWKKLIASDPHAVHSDGLIKVNAYETSTSCSVGVSDWETDGFVQIDPAKTYTLSYWSKYSINPLFPSGVAKPTNDLSFYRSDASYIGEDIVTNIPSGGSGVWKMYSKTYGPSGIYHWPSGTTQIKLDLTQAGTGSTSDCVVGTEYSTVTFDDASLAALYPLGGVDKDAKLDKPQAISSAKDNDDNNTLPIAAGVAGAAIAAGAATFVHSRKRRS